MGATETGNIKERIDTNKNGFVDTKEINDFIFDSKDGTNNLNELGNYLNSIPLRQSNQDIIKRALIGYFLSPEWGNESKKIGDKVKSNQQLEKREISLLYLQMLDITSRTGSPYQGNFDPNKPLEQICGGKLLTFIKQQYNNPLYNPQAQKSPAQKFQDNQRKDQFGLYTKETPKNVEIPQIPQLDEKNLDNVYNYCYRLIDRAEQNFPNDVANIRNNARAEHYDQSKENLPEFARYDILLFAFEKYSESITSKHENLIKQAGYRDYEEFSAEMKELQQFWGWISEKYPNLEEALTVLQKFGEEVENNKSKYFKNDEEIEKAGKDSEEFNQYIETKSKEYKVNEIKTMLEKDPETSEEAQRYCEGMKNLIEFQDEISKKGESYGDSLERYQKYMQGSVEISQKYPSINEHIEIQRRYANDIQQMGKKVDFDKYEKYNKLREDSVIDKDLNNMSILGKIIMDPQNEHFPILGVKNAQAEKQKKIDAFRDNLQKKNGPAYWLLTSLSGLVNGFISGTVGVGTGLGYMVLSLCGKDKADLDKRKKFYDNLKIHQSSKQTESIYYVDEEGPHLNFNWHNGVSTVSSSVTQMLCLITGGGAIGRGIGKATGVAEKIASKAGLFSFSFINQVGQSYQEANSNGLKGGTAFAYSMLSATIQSALELVSPNEVLLGSGNNITKELIKNLCKDGSKNSFIMLGKTFLKNVGMEIGEEIGQETLQLAAGNLINMYADNKWGSELGADWSWQNFAQTAIITALTTGITTGASYALQMGNMNQKGNNKLFTDVINNEATYASVMEMLDRAIAGEVKIPNTDITSLQQLKTDFLSVNDVGSNLHEERRKTRLNGDGTYDPRVKTTTDQAWIQQHDGQTEVDIANTTFENLPSDWQHENLEAAKVAESLVHEALTKGENITTEMIEDMSSKVHEERLKRNQWAKGGELDVPYDQLPETEKAKDRNQVLLAIEVTKQNSQNEYFNGKSHEFNISGSQAKLNSQKMDNILNEINEKNKSKKLKELGKEISKQYEQATGEKIELTDEQLLSVLDAHEQDGILGELTTGQLKQKVKILSETITDPGIRRFVLEAGFCGSIANVLQAAQNFYQENPSIIYDGIDFLGKSVNNAYKSSKKQNRKEYKIGEEVSIPRYDGSVTHGAYIQSYDPRTGRYLVIRYQNGQAVEKHLTTEELNSVNGETIDYQESSNTSNGYIIGQEVNIIKKDGEITKARITEIHESMGLHKAEWDENGKTKFYYFTTEELDTANQSLTKTNETESLNNNMTESQSTKRKEMADIKRASDVAAIGDLHGEYTALKGNLEYAGLAKEMNGHLQWTGGNKKVVFQGDILSDRGTNGLRIITEIHQLKEQAQSLGGDIDIIVGNHDDFMISYLTGRNGVHKDGIDISIGDWAGGINEGQGKGILELVSKFYKGQKYRLNNGRYDFKKILKNGHDNILNNMRESTEGRIILEEICNMKVVSQIDDVLYCHTNPTKGMLQYLTNGNIQDNINTINQKYQGYLRKVLLGEGGPTISSREFNEISDLFLDTSNRDISGIEYFVDILRDNGINMISHGHSGGHGQRNGQYVYDNNIVDINGLKIVDTDFSYGKHGETEGRRHSISVIQQSGGNVVTGDNVQYIEQEGANSDYFEGKSHKFNVTESQARSNSLNMDRILNDMNEQNKSEMLQQLREQINEQYMQATGQELLLTDEQLLSIIDAHEQDGILGELTIGQLKQKVETLDKTITDSNVRRFLLEAGFCGEQGLIFDPSYVTHDSENDGAYRINKKEPSIEHHNNPGYQSLEQAKQSLQGIIDSLEGGPYTDREEPLYQEKFKKDYKSENYEQDIDAFITYAQEKEQPHKQIFLNLATKAGAKALFIGKPKKKERILEKVRDNYRSEKEGLEGIKDYTRATILFDTFADFGKGLKELENMKIKGKIKDFTIKNRITKDGCNDIFVNIQTEDGYVSEVQFHVPEVLVFRDEALGELTIKRYGKDHLILNSHPLTTEIFDLSNKKYKSNLEFYNKIIDGLNEEQRKKELSLPKEQRKKELSLPKEQNQIVHDHDMYDIIRILENYEETDIMRVLYPHFGSETDISEIQHYIDDLIKDLKKMKENLGKEALDWYRQRIQ